MRKIFFGILIAIVITFASYNVSLALFKSNATSDNNVFAAAETFPSVTPSVSPSPSEVPVSPSISPSVSPFPAPKNSNLFVSDGYTCSDGASDTSVVKGQVSIAKESDLIVSVTISNATPNTSYDLWVNQDPGSCPLSSPTVSTFITTDSNGDGSNTLNNHNLTNGSSNYWVSLVGGSDVLRSKSVNF